MSSFLVPFSNIVPKSFNLPSQTHSPPSPSSPLPSLTSAALSAAPTAAFSSAVLSAAPTALSAAPMAALSASPMAALSSAAPSGAAPAATRLLVPPGFMARVRAPLVPPVQPNGSGKYAGNRPNTYQAAQTNNPSVSGQAYQTAPQVMFGPSLSTASSSAVSGRAHEAVCQAMLGQIRTLASGFDKMRKEVEQMKRLNGHQGTLITGLKEEERAFKENKKVIGDLEANVGMLIDHAEEKERVLNALEGKVGKGEEDNRALRKDVGDLKEEIRQLRRLVKKIWVGASIVGGFVLVGGVVAWVRKN